MRPEIPLSTKAFMVLCSQLPPGEASTLNTRRSILTLPRGTPRPISYRILWYGGSPQRFYLIGGVRAINYTTGIIVC